MKSMPQESPTTSVVIVLLQDDSELARVDLAGVPIMFGQADDCDVIVPETSVAQHHARLLLRHGAVFVESQDCTSVTAVNEQPVDTYLSLHSNDVLRLGDWEVEIRIVDSDKVPPPPSSDGSKIVQESINILPAFATKRLVPLVVCCVGFGWMSNWFIPPRFFIQVPFIPIAMLAVPSLMLAVLACAYFIRPAVFPRKQALLALVFTMLIGIAILLGFYRIADASLGMQIKGPPKIAALMVILKFIGWSVKVTESVNLGEKFLGYIVGVGLCEELTKMLPLLFLLPWKESHRKTIGYRSFLMIGFFSGLGFGIGEAILRYSPWGLSHVQEASGNVLRWFACVPSHAIWTVIDAAFLWMLAPFLIMAKNIYQRLGLCALAVLAAAVLHGTYDVLCGSTLRGIILNGFAILLMCFVVRFVATWMPQAEMSESVYNENTHGIMGWVKSYETGRRRFWRMYAFSCVMIVASLLLSMPDGWRQDQSGNDENARSPVIDQSISSGLYEAWYNYGLNRAGCVIMLVQHHYGYQVDQSTLIESIIDELYTKGYYHPDMSGKDPQGKRALDSGRYEACVRGALDYWQGKHRDISPQLVDPPYDAAAPQDAQDVGENSDYESSPYNESEKDEGVTIGNTIHRIVNTYVGGLICTVCGNNVSDTRLGLWVSEQFWGGGGPDDLKDPNSEAFINVFGSRERQVRFRRLRVSLSDPKWAYKPKSTPRPLVFSVQKKGMMFALDEFRKYQDSFLRADLEQASNQLDQVYSVLDDAKTMALFWSEVEKSVNPITKLTIFNYCNLCGGSNVCLTCKGSGDCPKCRGVKKCAKCNGVDSRVMKNCDKCNGGVCLRCNGSGRCAYCGGYRTCPCPVCKGRCSSLVESLDVCSSCGGYGTISGGMGRGKGSMSVTCVRCGGSGHVRVCKSIECENCNGKGQVRCEACNAWGGCTYCRGTGRLSNKCDVCGGTGLISVICPACSGSGLCDVCSGIGKCHDCGGTGKCRRCGSFGIVKYMELPVAADWLSVSKGCWVSVDSGIYTRVPVDGGNQITVGDRHMTLAGPVGTNDVVVIMSTSANKQFIKGHGHE